MLVFHDLLGIYEGRAPRFVKRFAEVKQAMVEGMRAYAERGPRAAASRPRSTRYAIDPDELERFREIVAPGKAWDVADAMS